MSQSDSSKPDLPSEGSHTAIINERQEADSSQPQSTPAPPITEPEDEVQHFPSGWLGVPRYDGLVASAGKLAADNRRLLGRVAELTDQCEAQKARIEKLEAELLLRPRSMMDLSDEAEGNGFGGKGR